MCLSGHSSSVVTDVRGTERGGGSVGPGIALAWDDVDSLTPKFNDDVLFGVETNAVIDSIRHCNLQVMSSSTVSAMACEDGEFLGRRKGNVECEVRGALLQAGLKHR
jgi:hypothetical protein